MEMISKKYRYWLAMQGNGNLVQYDSGSGKWRYPDAGDGSAAVWASITAGPHDTYR